LNQEVLNKKKGGFFMPPVPLNENVLTGLYEYFQNLFIGGTGILKNPALSIFGIVLIIDLLLAILLNIGEIDNIKLLCKKILKYGFMYWLIINFPTVLNCLLNGFKWIGNAAGSGTLTSKTLVDPSLMTTQGFKFIEVIFERIGNLFQIAANPLMALPYFSLGMLIFFSLCFIGIQVFLTYLEFYIVAVLSLMMIPFGTNKYTSFIAQKAGNAIFSLGVKLMVLVFISAAITPVLRSWALPQNFDINHVLYLSAASLTLAFLSWHAPNVVSTFMSGMPSFNASSVVSPVISTANSAVVTAATMGAGAPAAIAAAGGSSAGSAVKAATKTTS